MKKINTTPITTGSAMPLKSGSLEHLQSAYQEPLIDIVQTFEARNDTEGFPNYTTPVIMYGCRRTGIGVSQGVVAYGTELYRAQAANITLGFGEVVVGTITTTYFTGTNADPVTFSDSTNNNVHEIREIVWSAGISGSGSFDFDDCLMWGRWQTVTSFNNSYLSSDAGTLTLPGGITDYIVKWKQVGRTVIIDYKIIDLNLASSDSLWIGIEIPFNATFKEENHATCSGVNIGASPTSFPALCYTVAGTNAIRFQKYTGQWLISSSIELRGQITVELDKF